MKPLAPEPFRERLDLLPGQTVNDTRLLAMEFEKGLQLLASAVARLDRVVDIRTVVAVLEETSLSEAQPLLDIRLRATIRGRCQRDSRCFRSVGKDLRKLQIVGTKIVPPLAHTVGFVDGKERNFQLTHQLLEGG